VRNQITFIGWLSAETFIEGIKQAGLGCPTRKAFVTNLRLVKDWTAGGAFDPVDLAEGFGRQYQCLYYVKVQNAAFVPLFDGKELCGKPIRIAV
jgi:hypothetical protein